MFYRQVVANTVLVHTIHSVVRAQAGSVPEGAGLSIVQSVVCLPCYCNGLTLGRARVYDRTTGLITVGFSLHLLVAIVRAWYSGL